MYTLVIAVPLILLFSLVTSDLSFSTKFCPHEMTNRDKQTIDSVTSCNELKGSHLLYDWCRSYKKCVACPAHGIC